MTDERRHRNEREWLRFVASQRTSAGLVADVRWLEREYPGSFKILADELRQAYKRIKKREDDAHKRFIAGL